MNVNVISPDGEIGNVAPDQVQDAISQGYQVATQEDLAKENAKQEAGEGLGNQLRTGVEGALSGATLGLSRFVSNDPRKSALLKEANPGIEGVGELAGTLATAPLGGELASAGTGIASRILGESTAAKIASHVIGGALEGSMYGASAPISEDALGDPSLTASKAFTQIGLGGLFGGAIGGVSSALGIGAKSLLPKNLSEEAQSITGTGTSTLEGEATTTAKDPLKMQGTIDFGMQDEKILKQAEPLNPKNPLSQNDLDFLKVELKKDRDMFQKLGSPELPVNDPMATDKVYVGDTVRQGMKNLEVERQRLNQAADDALTNTMMPNGAPLSMTKNQYGKMFNDAISEVKASKEFGLPIGKKAVAKLETWLDAGKDLPDQIPATDIRDILQNIRDEGKLYSRNEGLKNDFVSKSLNKVQSNLDDYLKDNSSAYKAIQKEFKPFTNKYIELEDHLNWNKQTNDSNLVGDWVTNRIMKPFQSALPGTKGDADLIRWFSPYAGADLEKTAKTNFIYGKLNPDLASAGQKGSWGARVVEGLGALKNPTAIPGQVLSGTAKIALTGELPDFITQMRAKGVQDLLLGKSSNPSAVNAILNKMSSLGQKGSALLDGPIGNLLVPAGVKLHQFIDQSESVDHADRKLEVLMNLEKAQKKADAKIQASIKGIFKPQTTQHEIMHDPFLKLSPKELGKHVNDLREHANELTNNPEMLINHLSQANKGMDGAPNVMASMNGTAIRALQFLSNKINIDMPEGNKLPLDPQFPPSKSQLYSLTKTMNYINNPWDVLKEVSSGRVSQEGKDVLLNVHPELYNDMKAQLMSELSLEQAKGKSIPMPKRLGISFFLGEPLDSTMTQSAIASSQATFAMPQATNQQPNPTATNSKNLNLSANAMTPLQKVAAR